MTPEERSCLLDDLQHGRTSRNRELERFARPPERAVLSGYRMVKALLGDVSRPGVRVHARWVRGGESLAVALEDPALRYRRTLLLSPWEAAFLGGAGGPGFVFPVERLPEVR
ncbi:MAG: hypothetical protein SCH98_12990 [Deferrisomatales bacterium]|nr:hypothetical protein [Deferrisomatales bacterium]